ncbi:MAG: hypothetical protein JSV56_01285, partial [Methanomassiliicoccales archaeon]
MRLFGIRPVKNDSFLRKYVVAALLIVMIAQALAAIASAEVYFNTSDGYYLDDFEGENQTKGINLTVDSFINEGNITLDYDLYLGTGSDGDLLVNTPTTRWLGSKIYDVNSSSTKIEPYVITGFEDGDEILIINMLSGVWETAFVKNVSSPYLYLESPLQNSYLESSKAQIVHIWHFNNVTVSGSTLTTQAWDGNTGGILAFRAAGYVNLLSSGSYISVTGKGFAGGGGGAGGDGGDGGSPGPNAPPGSTTEWRAYDGSNGQSGPWIYGGPGGLGAEYSGGGIPGVDYYIKGGDGGDGGDGTLGEFGDVGARGYGSGGGLPGSPTGGGRNPSSPELVSVHMGGGGAGGRGGDGGAGGGGGASGGGSYNASGSGTEGGYGGDGGDGAGGGKGGGIIFFSCASLNNSGEINSDGEMGLFGLTGEGGLGGGDGGIGANAMIYHHTFNNTYWHWGAGGGGGGGQGASGGDGGDGGGGGAGGTILIQSYEINSSTGDISVEGGIGGTGFMGGAGGPGGWGGNGGNDELGGDPGSSGTPGDGGFGGLNGVDGQDGESGMIRMDYLNLSEGFAPSSSAYLNDLQYKPYGEVCSQTISPPTIEKWLKFTANTTVPENTTLEFFITDPINKTVYAYGNSSQASEEGGGIELHLIPIPKLQIKAILRTEDTFLTPVIHSWNISWETTLPSAPENLIANLSKEGDHINLSWEAVTYWKDLVGYNIYRSDDGLTYYLYDSVDNQTLIYQDTSVQIGRIYRYKVTATSYPELESPFSNPVEILNEKDYDLDGVGNSLDEDDDGDSYPDGQDAFPLNSSEWLDTDGDGLGNNIDQDDDNDGHQDILDPHPLIPDGPEIVGTEMRITWYDADELNPDIYGDKIVWYSDRNGDWDIYMYDLSSYIMMQITTNPQMQYYPAIYGDRIVWSDYRNGPANIYMYDLSTDTETQISSGPANQYGVTIYKDKIVWSDFRASNWDIYLYNLSTGLEMPVITNSADQYYPYIYEDKIVWHDTRYGNSDIFLYNLSTGVEMPICTNLSDQSRAVKYGDVIVWDDWRNDPGV